MARRGKNRHAPDGRGKGAARPDPAALRDVLSGRRPVPAAPEGTLQQQRRWQQGRQAFLRGQYAEAVRAWSGCDRREAPAAIAEARLRLALAAKQPGEALAQLAEAVRAAPDDARLHAHLSLALWRTGEAEPARAAARQALALAPAEPRYRELTAILAALTGQTPPDADWHLRLLAAAGGTGPEVPPAPAGAPQWARALLQAMRALTAGAWTEALSEATRGLGLPGTTPAAAEAFRFYAAAAAAGAGQWEAVLAAAPAGGHFASRATALLRTAAAQVLVAAAAGSGDPQAAEAAVEVLQTRGGLSGEVRDRAGVAIGLLYAGREDWTRAVRHWTAAGRRYELAQPLALAHERAGDHEAAQAIWERLAARLRRDGAATWPGIAPQTAATAVYDHLAATAARRGDLEEAARFAEQALAGTAPDVQRRLDVARRIIEAHPEPSPAWERAAALLEAAAAEDPRDADAWMRLAAVRRGQGRMGAALRAAQRWHALAPLDRSRAAVVAEDFGRAILNALQDADFETAARLADGVGRLGGTPAAGGTGSWSDLLAELALAALARVRGGKRPGSPLSRWEDAFHGRPGEAAPRSAFALRGFLALLAGHRHKAERLFDRLGDDPAWEEAGREGEPALAWYLRWMGHAHCWARQVRAGGAPPGDCAEAAECLAMRKFLSRAAVEAPGGVPVTTAPRCLGGCPHAAGLYARWTREFIAVKGLAFRMAARMARDGFDPAEIFAQLDEELEGV